MGGQYPCKGTFVQGEGPKDRPSEGLTGPSGELWEDLPTAHPSLHPMGGAEPSDSPPHEQSIVPGVREAVVSPLLLEACSQEVAFGCCDPAQAMRCQSFCDSCVDFDHPRMRRGLRVWSALNVGAVARQHHPGGDMTRYRCCQGSIAASLIDRNQALRLARERLGRLC